MPAPSKVASPAKKPEKPKDTGRFISATEGWGIVRVADGWKGTPYAPLEKDGKRVADSKKYEGAGAVKKKGADCSGSTWAIYKEAGFPYGPYANTVAFVNKAATEPDFISAWLQKLVGTEDSFVKGTHFFKKVSLPQAGDIGWWKGHMAIYDQNSGMCGKESRTVGNIWSAYNSKGPDFGPAHTKFWDGVDDFGIVTWYRCWIAP